MSNSTPKMIFVNLPVENLDRSVAFYEAIGGRKIDACSDETAVGIAFSDSINVMLLTREKFRTFTPREIGDAHRFSEVLTCMSCESRDVVDATVKAGISAGGEADPGPVQEHDFMYGRSLADPDGHIWEFMWMRPEMVLGGTHPTE